MTSDVLLAAHGIGRCYGTRVAVRALDLDLRRGEVLGLLGLNGAGKSTTLQILTGVIAPHWGRVVIGGHDLTRRPQQAKALLGYLPEVPPLYPDARVDEYLAFCAGLHRIPGREIATAVAKAKQRCGLQEVGSRLIRNLSKGYQQRVGIAQAIVHEPPLLILDEPTVGLDPAQIQEVRGLVRQLGREHAVLLSTHLLAEAESVCTRVLILHQGRAVYDQELRANPRHLLLALRAPPAPDVLAALPGVTAVTALGDGRFECCGDDLATLGERLAAAAVAGDWGLRELTPGTTALERTFLDLTREHRARDAAPC
jgi:ABC-2 type transport system ATP-binding protein